jgi:sulfur carrier protein ThiS
MKKANQAPKRFNGWACKRINTVQVSVKLFGALRQFLPAGSGFNNCTLTIPEQAKLSDVLLQLPIPADKKYLVIINDERLDDKTLAEISISETDQIVLIPPIKGG